MKTFAFVFPGQGSQAVGMLDAWGDRPAVRDTLAEASDALTCGPGPFSMANADTTSDILRAAGFEQIALRRVDIQLYVGQDPQEAVDVAFALGPAAETIRLAGDDAEAVRPLIERDLLELAEEYRTAEGTIVAPASAWVVTARVPE